MKSLCITVFILIVGIVCIVGVNNVYYGSEYFASKIQDKVSGVAPISLKLDSLKTALENSNEETSNIRKQIAQTRIMGRRTRVAIRTSQDTLERLLENVKTLRASLADPNKTRHFGYTRRQVEDDLAMKSKKIAMLTRKIKSEEKKLLQYQDQETGYQSMIAEYRIKRDAAAARLSELELKNTQLQLAQVAKEPNVIRDNRLVFVFDGIEDVETRLEQMEIDIEVSDELEYGEGIDPARSSSYDDLDLNDVIAEG